MLSTETSLLPSASRFFDNDRNKLFEWSRNSALDQTNLFFNLNPFQKLLSQSNHDIGPPFRK